MFGYIVNALRQNPELAIFLTLAIGFIIGRIKFGSFSLGIVVGTLLAGVVVGQLDVKVPSIVKTVFFDLFLFTTGYKVGPQFFRGLKRDALSQLALTVVLCVTCLLSAFLISKLMGYDIGTAAGLLAGSFTESTVIGTAGDAINRLALTEAEKKTLLDNIPVAYAVTYLIGTAGLVWFLPKVGPKLMGVDLKEEGKALQSEVAGGSETESGALSAMHPFDIRVYKVTNPQMANRTIAELEQLPRENRLFILRVRHEGVIIEPRPDVRIHLDDVIAVSGRSRVLIERGAANIGPETDDPALLDMPMDAVNVVVTNKKLLGKPFRELAVDEEFRVQFRGVYLRKFTRAGMEMPITMDSRVEKGDLLSLFGTKTDVDRAAKAIGYPDWPTDATDMVFVGTGIVIGGLIGLLSVTIGGLPMTLTASGGALVMGLVFGWLRSVRPFFGRIPEPAIYIFDTVGLCVFIAVVGLSAGPSFVSGLAKTGISLVLAGIICAMLPHITAILFGRYVLKMNPLILLGACSGAGTITAALRAIQEESGSRLPALGYTVPYAVGNIILTAWGPVIVTMMAYGR